MPETAGLTASPPADTLAAHMPPPGTVPVYAAGSGAPDTALSRLAKAGWALYSDGLGNVTYRSPDGCVRAEFGPETGRYNSGEPLWEVTYSNASPYAKARNNWTATFSEAAPAEAIAGFLAALADAAGLELDR
jgi:hypothetical protein